MSLCALQTLLGLGLNRTSTAVMDDIVARFGIPEPVLVYEGSEMSSMASDFTSVVGSAAVGAAAGAGAAAAAAVDPAAHRSVSQPTSARLEPPVNTSTVTIRR